MPGKEESASLVKKMESASLGKEDRNQQAW